MHHPRPTAAAGEWPPGDLPKAARDWPNPNLITYHAAFKPGSWDYQALEAIRCRKLGDCVPDIEWTLYAQTVQHLPNCYAEIGTTFASAVVTFPTVTAHLLWQLLKYLGPERVPIGSDSVLYGAPRWQREVLWRFRIPEGIREAYGYPTLDESVKRQILVLSSARLYGLLREPQAYRSAPPDWETHLSPERRQQIGQAPVSSLILRDERVAEIKRRYRELGVRPSLLQHGWIFAQLLGHAISAIASSPRPATCPTRHRMAGLPPSGMACRKPRLVFGLRSAQRAAFRRRSCPVPRGLHLLQRRCLAIPRY